jgi:hypothetical protein
MEPVQDSAPRTPQRMQEGAALVPAAEPAAQPATAVRTTTPAPAPKTPRYDRDKQHLQQMGKALATAWKEKLSLPGGGQAFELVRGAEKVIKKCKRKHLWEHHQVVTAALPLFTDRVPTKAEMEAGRMSNN